MQRLNSAKRIVTGKVAGLFLMILLTYIEGLGQKAAKDEFKATLDNWKEGNIQLNDQTRLRGLLRFNHFEGTLTYQSGEGERTFTARTIQGFDITDEGKKRYFISSAIDNNGQDVLERYFFEILCELKHFAILSRETSYYRGSNSVREETLFVFDDEGTISPYMTFVSTNSSGLNDWQKEKKYVINQKLLKRYTCNFYPHLEDFAKDNHLSFREKDELLTILNHYKQFEKSEPEGESGHF